MTQSPHKPPQNIDDVVRLVDLDPPRNLTGLEGKLYMDGARWAHDAAHAWPAYYTLHSDKVASPADAILSWLMDATGKLAHDGSSFFAGARDFAVAARRVSTYFTAPTVIPPALGMGPSMTVTITNFKRARREGRLHTSDRRHIAPPRWWAYVEPRDRFGYQLEGKTPEQLEEDARYGMSPELVAKKGASSVKALLDYNEAQEDRIINDSVGFLSDLVVATSEPRRELLEAFKSALDRSHSIMISENTALSDSLLGAYGHKSHLDKSGLALVIDSLLTFRTVTEAKRDGFARKDLVPVVHPRRGRIWALKTSRDSTFSSNYLALKARGDGDIILPHGNQHAARLLTLSTPFRWMPKHYGWVFNVSASSTPAATIEAISNHRRSDALAAALLLPSSAIEGRRQHAMRKWFMARLDPSRLPPWHPMAERGAMAELEIRRKLVALRRKYAREGKKPSRRVTAVLEGLLAQMGG